MENTTKLSAEQIAKLDEAQRDGRACVHCAGDEGALKPIGWLDGCQVFEHAACGDGRNQAAIDGAARLLEAVASTYRATEARRLVARVVKEAAGSLLRPAERATLYGHAELVIDYCELFQNGMAEDLVIDAWTIRTMVDAMPRGGAVAGALAEALRTGLLTDDWEDVANALACAFVDAGRDDFADYAAEWVAYAPELPSEAAQKAASLTRSA